MVRWLVAIMGIMLCGEAAGQAPYFTRDYRSAFYSEPQSSIATPSPGGHTPPIPDLSDPWATPPATAAPQESASSTPPRFRLRGRIDTDFLFASQSEENEEAFGELNDKIGLRRARIGAEGHLSPESRYVFELDFAGGQVVLRDGYYARGKVQDRGEYKFGHMREPFSLEGGTSANSFAFMERSPINVLDPARNWGVGITRGNNDENWTWSAGLFQAGTNPSDTEFGPGSTTDLTSRWTLLAQYEDEGRHLIHFGAAVSGRIANQGVINVAQAAQSPLLDFTDSTESPFVPRLTFPANFQQLINLQWAAVSGPLWVQIEWYGTMIFQRNDGDVFLHGSYLDLGYFVTGEHRTYLRQGGVFGPVSVQRPVLRHFSSKEHNEQLGGGAWELTARLAYLNFLDYDAPLDENGEPAGVILPQATFGVNWYLADRLRLMFNYTYAVPYEASVGDSNVSVFGLRLGMFW